MSSDFDTRMARVAALGEPVRRALYRFVAGRHRPVSRDEAAEGVGVPRHVAKFHLDRLEEDGLLDTEFRRPPGRSGPGAGRPSKLYRRSKQEVAVSLPERHYELAGKLMADAITTATREQVPVGEALSAAAADIGSALGEETAGRMPPQHDDMLSVVGEVLDEYGYEPRREDGSLILANCPFHALAKDYTDLVCGMNLDIMRGLVACLPADRLEARLDPAPDRCCVRIIER
ncbi:MAG TPA: helix-turn-helix domain-containing protein [Tepidiformaceae bacterium]|nr:helix-turn-helix domain-containing protein [Tepidiformaceae bacterium]